MSFYGLGKGKEQGNTLFKVGDNNLVLKNKKCYESILLEENNFTLAVSKDWRQGSSFSMN
jgi:hypothetical protein